MSGHRGVVPACLVVAVGGVATPVSSRAAEGAAPPIALRAEAGMELGLGLDVDGVEEAGLYAAGYVQQDGTLVTAAGFAGYYGRLGRFVRTYIDVGLGAAFVAHDGHPVLACRSSGGLRVAVFTSETRRTAFLKVGPFIELVADGVNAEPAGIAAVTGLAF